MNYPFTEAEANAAHEAWGCNCGPTALAFALQVKLDVVRPALVGFDQKRYTNPTMMSGAMAHFRRPFSSIGRNTTQKLSMMFDELPALVRIQWCGPWTADGANPKWAYRQTHWICTWLEGVERWVFDCNCGATNFQTWLTAVVPAITQNYPKADGRWFPTHVWRLLPVGGDA